jgi:DNA-binding response OmpR family regulator
MADAKKKIIYIEDEPFFGKTLEHLFTEAGFDIDIATDGESGLAKAEKNGYDLVLLDLVLAKMDGFEVLKRLTEGEKTKRVPVIVLSNLGSEADVEKTKALGAKEHFVKVTMDPRKLVQVVKEFLGIAHSRA